MTPDPTTATPAAKDAPQPPSLRASGRPVRGTPRRGNGTRGTPPVRPGRPLLVAAGTVALVVMVAAVVAAYDGSPQGRTVVAILGAAWFGVWLLATAPRDHDPP